MSRGAIGIASLLFICGCTGYDGGGYDGTSGSSYDQPSADEGAHHRHHHHRDDGDGDSHRHGGDADAGGHHDHHHDDD